MSPAAPRSDLPPESLDDFLDDLLGKPSLIRGEDQAQYRRLQAAVTRAMRPQDLFDKIWARELADKLWDLQRNKSGAAALVETAFVFALTDLLRQGTPPPSEVDVAFEGDSALERAKEYYDAKTTPKRRKQLSLLLEQYSITEAQIRAKAMEICSNSIQVFRRMEENNEKTIRRILKDSGRRPSTAREPSRPSSEESAS